MVSDMRFCIVHVDDIHKVDWSTVAEESLETCRWNRNKTKILLKTHRVPRWYVDKPVYNWSKIKEILKSDEW